MKRRYTLDNGRTFTASQIRYMIWLCRLSRDRVGVKNVELSTALGLSKPSVHNMLRSLSDMGVVVQESFGLAHLTDCGRAVAEQYEKCYVILEQKMAELCGKECLTENAVCAILADVPYERINILSKKS